MSQKTPSMDAMKYYDRGCCETRKFITSNELSYYEGCVIKYVVRWRFKDGLKDLYKARDYVNWLIEENERGKGNEMAEQALADARDGRVPDTPMLGRMGGY